jgi:hypothetical protein
MEKALTRTTGFGENEVAQIPTSAGSALAARATAEVQARFIMAERHPRDVEKVRQNLLKNCTRLGFAEMANYAKPAGKKEVNGKWEEQYVEGASVHLIRAALPLWGNCAITSTVIDDTEDIQTHSVVAVDYETNYTQERSFVVEKTVEKKGTGKDGEKPPDRDIISVRTNSYGKKVFLCEATPDEIIQRAANISAKIERTLGEKLIPKDIIQEARQICYETVRLQINENPEQSKRDILDKFFRELNIPADVVEQVVGHSLDIISPVEIAFLRRVFMSVRDGEMNIQDVLAGVNNSGSAEGAEDARVKAIDDLRRKSVADTKTKKTAQPETVNQQKQDEQPTGQQQQTEGGPQQQQGSEAAPAPKKNRFGGQS